MIGRTLSHFEVLEKIGAGGMGEVYRARDLRLGRDVALKVLPADVAEDPERLQRFQREAQALAALNHPHIITVYSVEETDGVHFLTMELAQGRTLAELIPEGGMALERFLDLAIPLADAVATAHAHGVVHRDLKPSNVMVTDEDVVKVLDFGLAKQAAAPAEGTGSALTTETLQQLTQTGQVMGSVPYMAPEQLQGRPAGPRSDIFSLGATFYQMITGKPPFTGESGPELVSAILRDRPPPVSEVRTGLPHRLGELLTRCLEKDPQRRVPTALELRNALEQLREVDAEAGNARSRDRPSIAVLPFVNMNRDEESEFFADGLTEEILNALTRTEGLRVASRTSVFRYKDSSADIRNIAGELEVATVLEGSVRRLGNRLRVTAQLIDAADGLHRWSRRYDRQLEDVFEVQDDVARSVAEELAGTLATGAQPLVHRPTESPEAYDLYLKGRYQWERMAPEGFQAAIRYFKQAIATDPEFAQPRAWLAIAYHYLTIFGHVPPSQSIPEARREMERALALDPELADAHEARGLYLQYYDYDWEGTEKAYRRAMELQPGDVTVQAWYAIFLVRFLDRQDEAIAAGTRALEMDPVSFEALTLYVYVSIHARRPEECLEVAERAVELYPGVPLARWARGLALMEVGRLGEAVEEFRKGLDLAPLDPPCSGGLGHALGRSGRRDEARELLTRLLEEKRQHYHPAIPIALTFLGLGEDDEAMRWLETAFEDAEPLATFFSVWPALDPVRDDPRFQEILRKMGLERS